jgi:NDP-sugar pyrophosphorylase family protein
MGGATIMKAIVLAGGKGTRLRPFTHVFPKPLMPLGDENPMPILEVVLRQLARYGFRDVTIITGYLTEYIETFCRDGQRFGTRIQYRRELAPLGTAGGLTLVDRPRRPVLVLNGDILTTLDFAAMYDDHRAGRASATIAAFPRQVRIDFGVLDFNEESPHVLRGYREKPSFSFEVSMGLYILSPGAWDYLAAGEPLTMPELLEAMRADGHAIHAFRQDCEWLDIGRHDDYEAANALFQARREAFLGPEARPRLKIG